MISILNFITSYTGWQVFAASVLELINPSRLPGQLKNLVTIIVALVENDCVHGAVDVAQRIYSTTSKIQQLDQADVDAYVDAIVALDAHPATTASGSVLDKFFLPFFDQLACYQKCRLFIDLQEANYSRLDCLPSSIDLYKKLARNIFENGLSSSGRTLEIIDDVIAAYVRIGDQNYLEMFIDRIWWQTDSNDREGNSIVWFEAVVRAAVLSPLVKPAFVESLKKLLVIFHVFIIEPSTQFEDIRRAKLAQFVLVLLSLERIPQLADPTRLETFFTVDKLPAFRLGNLLVDLVQLDHVTSTTSGRNLLMKLGQSLLRRESTEWQDILPISALLRALLKILKCSSVSPEVDLLRQFIGEICRCEWILSSPDIWSSNSSMVIEVTRCLFSFGDYQSVSIFIDKMLALYPVDEPNYVIANIIKCPEILHLIDTCPRGRNFLRLLVVQRLLAITMKMAKKCHEDNEQSDKHSLVSEKMNLEKFFDSLNANV